MFISRSELNGIYCCMENMQREIEQQGNKLDNIRWSWRAKHCKGCIHGDVCRIRLEAFEECARRLEKPPKDMFPGATALGDIVREARGVCKCE